MIESDFGANRFDFIFTSGKRKGRNYSLSSENISVVRSIVADSGCDTLPIDLGRIAAHLGIVEVRSVPLAEKGRLIRVPGGVIAEANAALSECDQRFAIAHEIAHVIIEKDCLLLGSQPLQRSKAESQLSYRRLEELCDHAAREILLPHDILRKKASGKKPDIALVKTISDEAQCSLELSAVRFLDVEHWSCRFVWWQARGKYYLPIKSVPDSPQDTLAQIHLQDEEKSLVARALRQQSVVTGIQRILLWDGAEEKYRAQCLPLDSQTAILLLDYS